MNSVYAFVHVSVVSVIPYIFLLWLMLGSSIGNGGQYKSHFGVLLSTCAEYLQLLDGYKLTKFSFQIFRLFYIVQIYVKRGIATVHNILVQLTIGTTRTNQQHAQEYFIFAATAVAVCRYFERKTKYIPNQPYKMK